MTTHHGLDDVLVDLCNPAEHKGTIAMPNEGRLAPSMLVQDVFDCVSHVISRQRLPSQAHADVTPLQQDDWAGPEGARDLVDQLQVRGLHRSTSTTQSLQLALYCMI